MTGVYATAEGFDHSFLWSDQQFVTVDFPRLLHLRRLNEYGVKYRILTEPFLDSTNGLVAEIMTPLLATLARQERVRLSERARAGLERARAQGKRLGRPRLVVSRGRADRLHRKGKSLAEIAATLKISKTSVHRLVRARG